MPSATVIGKIELDRASLLELKRLRRAIERLSAAIEAASPEAQTAARMVYEQVAELNEDDDDGDRAQTIADRIGLTRSLGYV